MTLQIKRIEEFNFDTEAFVADLRGGEALLLDVDKTTKEEKPLPVPGEYLVVDGDGRLIACSEVDDAEEYRRLLFIEDTPGAATGGMAPSSDMGGYGETMGYPSSYPRATIRGVNARGNPGRPAFDAPACPASSPGSTRCIRWPAAGWGLDPRPRSQSRRR